MSHLLLIDKWPKLADFAADIGVSQNTAKGMRRRKSVPPFYWDAMVKAAVVRGLDGVSLETLAQAVPARRVTEPAQARGAA